MLDSACLIFNPVAGQSDPDQDLSEIKRHLKPHIHLDIQFTTEDISAEQLAREAIERKVECLIASGGDGTVSQVAGVLVDTEIPLGIIPRGTANAFANALNIPQGIEGACKIILAAKERVVDMGKCDGKPMMLLAGVGLEAGMVEDANRKAKNRLGILAYYIAAFKQWKGFKTFHAQLETNDRIIEVEATAITIANIAPASSILAQGPAGIIMDDGLLDVTIFAPKNRWNAVGASYHLLLSALSEDQAQRNDIGYFRTQRIRVTTDPPQKVAVDGEVIGKTPVEIECVSRQLKVFVPDKFSSEQPEKLEGLPGLKIKSKTGKPQKPVQTQQKENKSNIDVLIVDYRIPD
ncbi:YegS/Rv2252/BmrU family lipid kinase [Capilliphycus salinus ALCB114379]|uniref:YegS/Rv2252/BmrU family lipid kinase n=1 Tax=Capilliphycus salinus TaxID=2768948 RepID=UPI0039A55DA6